MRLMILGLPCFPLGETQVLKQLCHRGHFHKASREGQLLNCAMMQRQFDLWFSFELLNQAFGFLFMFIWKTTKKLFLGKHMSRESALFHRWKQVNGVKESYVI